MRWQRHHTLWTVLGLGGMANTMFRRGLGPVLVPLRAEFALSYSQVSVVAFFPVLTYALMQVPAGHLGDRYGRGRVLLAGSLLAGSVLALAGAMPSFGGLVALLGLAGFGEGTLFGNDRPLVAVHTPPDRQATGQALTMASGGIGTLLGVLGAGLVAETFGWRYAFLLFAAPAFLFGWAVRRWIFPLPDRTQASPTGANPSGRVVWRTLATPRLLVVYAAGTALSFTNWFLNTWGPALFMDAGVAGVGHAAAYASSFSLPMLVGLPISGALVDRLSGTRSQAWFLAGLLAGASCLTVALGLGIRLQGRPVVLLAIAIGVVAFAFGGWPSLYVFLSAEALPHRLGLTYGLANTVWQAGAVSAPLIGGWLRDTTASFAVTCYLAAVLLGISAAAVLIVYRTEPQDGGQ